MVDIPGLSPETVGKVTVFATRGAPAERELLIFEHPTAGLQVPAGTVDPGEDFAAAALRELEEETGVRGDVAHLLYVEEQAIPRPNQLIVAADLIAFEEPDEGAQRVAWAPWRGWGVVPVEQRGDFTLIDVERWQTYPERITLERIGWVRTSSLASRSERRFFHAPVSHDAAGGWIHRAEDMYDFACRWVPLNAVPQLLGYQQGWLDLCAPQLR